MIKTFDVFKKELSSLRTGRANSTMLDLIKVEAYGQEMPINQLSSVTTPEPRTINIQVWDINNVTLTDPIGRQFQNTYGVISSPLVFDVKGAGVQLIWEGVYWRVIVT